MYYFDYQEPVFRPPSEAQSLIFQITIGCSQNHCKFCGMYKMKHFHLRSVSDIAADINAVPESHRGYYRRIFLADGDALIYPQEELLQILELLNNSFPLLNRVGIYASPHSLTTKTRGSWNSSKKKTAYSLFRPGKWRPRYSGAGP